ncbi:hypothetical protein MtrunA17_Chr1g0195361 [Medicago truncatula]|uniref:DUF538 family protein n=2 Tax=Medicago truncatula TaxID=3880 RepID=I3SMD1_MEDTR|nr:uncharacterized protein LOC11412469 [Medicago truncatula]AFK41423.1 unknown [Medicago truncatula]RHN81099.1 hypothetical protein MtrunA17_Chr1g0195361 [Medicago truncatula]
MYSLKSVLILLISLTISSSLSSCTLIEPKNLSAYDLLMEYGFPMGLLPKGAIGYSLNRETGQFSVYFEKTCSFVIESYTLSYKSTISGVISQNRLYKLKGVSVRILLLWLNIVEVSRKGNDIDFSVGITSAGFGVENFLECPQCGCGFDCNNILRLNGDVQVSSI